MNRKKNSKAIQHLKQTGSSILTSKRQKHEKQQPQ